MRFVLATLLGEPARFRDISTRARGVELLGGMELFETSGIVSIEERLAVGVARGLECVRAIQMPIASRCGSAMIAARLPPKISMPIEMALAPIAIASEPGNQQMSASRRAASSRTTYPIATGTQRHCRNWLAHCGYPAQPN